MFETLSTELPQAGRAAKSGSWQLAFAAVEALVVLGERAGAAALYPLVVEAIETGVVLDGYTHGRLVRTLAGMAAGADGRWDEAEAHFGRALRQAEAIGLRMERPDLFRFHAGMLIERGRPEDRQRSRRLLEEAIRAYQEFSMPRHEQMCRELLQSVSGS